MRIATMLCQRNNSRHLLEYFAWYKLMGVDTFIVYDHMSSDNSWEIIQKVAKHYDIRCWQASGRNATRESFWHTIHNFRNSGEFDWIISADADEIYLPTHKNNIKEVLVDYMDKQLTCLGIYWLMFGNNGHLQWEPGLVTECYTRRSPLKHRLNHHVKPIIRCGPQGGEIYDWKDGHVYHSQYGTYDLDGNLVPTGLNYPANSITHEGLRINHYWNKSWEYFKTVKQVNGYKSDRPEGFSGENLEESFWHSQNFNDEEDTLIWDRFGKSLKKQYNIMAEQINL